SFLFYTILICSVLYINFFVSSGNEDHLTLVILLLCSVVPLISAQNAVCANRFNDLSFADPVSCSSFYVCQRGKAVRRECSEGLYFDPKIQACNLQGLIKCFNGDRSVTYMVGNRSSVPDGSAKATAVTTASETTTCPPETTTTTQKPKQLLIESPIMDRNLSNGTKIIVDVLRSSRDCRDISDGVYLTDPRHCRRYYMCTRNRARRHNCPRKEWFDRELLICRSQDEVLNCPSNRN
ncbi:peritrophin-44, partial [Drosophila takahashii]|uniref:peritrophin-44 n=1 Tax=Drosophila takahashii TaxID=29030 RepID=UPI003899387F